MKIMHLIGAASLAALAFACGGSKAPTTDITTTTNATMNPAQPKPPSDPSQPAATPSDFNDAAGTGRTRTIHHPPASASSPAPKDTGALSPTDQPPLPANP